jgi:fructosamine-3-kinase
LNQAIVQTIVQSRTVGSDQTYLKQQAGRPDRFYEAEAAGLHWLAAARGARVVTVLAVEPGRIELERVHQARPSVDAAWRFGVDLARTHSAGAAAFGARPDGWDGPIYIGKRPLPVADEPRWGVFYARDRVLPYLEIAIDAGSVKQRESGDIREACDLISSGAFDDDQPPARIHGDLWNGNVLWSQAGVVLIDPAAHGGHRETDLAMLSLFGCPYLADILAAYDAAHPLRAGWRDRVPLHQLHPLAVHAASYGRSYGVALHDAALAVLGLA